MARQVSLGAKRRVAQAGKEEQGKKGAGKGGKTGQKDESLNVNHLDRQRKMTRKKDVPQGLGRSPVTKGAVAKGGQEKTTSEGTGGKTTRKRKTSEVPPASVPPGSEDTVKKQTPRGSRVKSAISSDSKTAGPKKTVKRLTGRPPGARAAGVKKGASVKKGDTLQPSGDVALKRGGERNKKGKAQASVESSPETQTRAGAVESATGDLGNKRRRKKLGVDDATGGAGQPAKPEKPNKRSKTLAESPRSPSRRPGLRNSETEQEGNAGLKRKGTESQGEVQVKKRKAGKKDTASTEESAKADPGNGNGPRRSSRNVKAESNSPPSDSIQDNLSPRAEDVAQLVDEDSPKAEKEGQESSEIPEENEVFGSEPVQGAQKEGLKERSDQEVTTRDDTKEAQTENADEIDKNMNAEGGEVEGENTEDDSKKVHINRAPVITLWVPVVAEREGFKFEEGLSFGKAIAGMYAHAKGKRLGVFEDSGEPQDKRETRQRVKADLEQVEVFGTKLSTKKTPEGHILAVDQSGKPIPPAPVLTYLKRAFGSSYDAVKGAMETLARAYPKEDIGSLGYNLYEKFRPAVPEGARGWGAKGFLDLSYLAQLTHEDKNHVDHS